MTQERLATYHRRAREKGVNPILYLLARVVLQPFFLLYFRLSRHGRQHVPRRGPLLVAANHRSFLDPFVIGCLLPWRRPMHYVAKVELFERRWQAWFLVRLGAIPIQRNQSDEEAMVTARMILERGGAVCIFPEGTRIRAGSLARPRRGVGRLALETGAAVLPVAVVGSEHARRGWRIRPRKVKLRAGRTMAFPRAEHPSPALATDVTMRIWPSIELQWEWLGGLPPLRTAAVIGAGSWGTAVAIMLARGGLEVQLGCRTREQATEMAQKRRNERYLPGVELPESLSVKRVGDIELAAADLVCLAVPSRALPAAVGAIADRVGQRSALLVLSKGMVAPMAVAPSDYVGERIRARAIACLGGPAHAAEAVNESAALVLGSRDHDLLHQLGGVFDEAGVLCERSEDLLGVELAGAAKNLTALAAAAAVPFGLNTAGAAAATIWRECVEYATGRGAESRTFAGLAGVGDLTATVLAPGSRNRRAGELLAEGARPEQILEALGQAAESLDSVPLMASAVTGAGLEAPGLTALDDLVAGRLAPGEWVSRVRQAEARAVKASAARALEGSLGR